MYKHLRAIEPHSLHRQEMGLGHSMHVLRQSSSSHLRHRTGRHLSGWEQQRRVVRRPAPRAGRLFALAVSMGMAALFGGLAWS